MPQENWQQKQTNRMTPTTLQGRMQARPSGTWHKLRLLGVTATDRDAWRHTVKVGLTQYEETQWVKAEEKRLRKKTVCLVSRSITAFTCSKCGTATPELVFTATTDAAQWVQIYGLSRPTNANGVFDNELMHYLLELMCILSRGVCKIYIILEL